MMDPPLFSSRPPRVLERWSEERGHAEELAALAALLCFLGGHWTLQNRQQVLTRNTYEGGDEGGGEDVFDSLIVGSLAGSR